MDERQRYMRETVEGARAMTEADLEWKPYYPNNMRSNGQEGWYCVIQNGDHARKYTIYFQYPEDENGFSHPEQGVDRYVLFERSYCGLQGPLRFPGPTADSGASGEETDGLSVNDFGTFIHAYPGLAQAKARALRQWQLVFGYALSCLLDDEKETVPE